ncbi:ATPase [Actinoplanes sp. SE50]|uniref:AAA family ATPase n=1 Tax=unclassified Actinoplanes TaxID=2626549 RepID=UPI00023EC237|nr:MULTISPECIES: AAA family ATPase [unclassified Actinoplanes]AEV83006.1 AAA ATPase central domain protein [Actinoplanes sp. SE50/110]ATO81402.1 ATPase [Actinoplanes sp. SE50]SLL98809.1 ATPase [Actinoplanes sp. SE50/110]
MPRVTRKRLPFWDRVKFLLLFAIAFFALVWTDMADDPLLPFQDALYNRLHSGVGVGIIVLAGLEVLRQLHYLHSEHAAWYHRLWTHGIFGGVERLTHRVFSDWTRFRLLRVFKWLLFLGLLAVVLGAVLDTSPAMAVFGIPALLWRAAPMFLQVIFILFIAVGQFAAIFWFLSRGGVEVYYPDDVKTRFTDVWGQDHVLERVKENIVYLERPEAIEGQGGYVPGGILLWGPPGTGKTLMAEAVAGETGRPYVFVDPGAFINMFFGVGVLKVKGLFRKLRKLALRYGGVIVFFDEADSLGNRGALAQGGPGGGFPRSTPAPFRDGCHGFSYLSDQSRWNLTRDSVMYGGGMGGGGGGMGTLEALLTELSGLKKPRGFVNRHVRRALGMRPKPPPKYRILVMMATNLPEALDEALLRPGRIDRIYKVGYPSKAGRVRTYQGYLAKVKHELTEEQVDKLATITPYATGATIKDTVNEALITAIRDGRDTITWRDVIRAKQLKELGPAENVEYIERERHAVAVHEACHAVVAYRTRHHMEIDIATIEKGSGYLGMVASIPPEDQFTTWRSHYESDILVSLASLAGERMFFDGDSSSGVSGDLESATAVATNMEGVWGMGSTVSSYAASSRLGTGTPGALPKGDKNDLSARRALADRIEDSLGEMLERAATILKENRREVLALAHALETHKTLTGEDVIAVLEGRPGPLIDGTVYADDRFIAEVESYHRAALAAHRGHGRLSTALPSRAVPEPLPVPVDGPADLPTGSEIWRRPDPVDANGATPEIPQQRDSGPS